MNKIDTLPDIVEERENRLKELGLTKEQIDKNLSLVKPCVDPNGKGYELLTLITSKSYNEENDLDKVIKFIKEGANLDYQSQKGNIPIIYCARKGYLETFITLLKFGANVNATNKNKTTCIMSAARHNSYQILEIAILCGGDMNARDFEGDTAIMSAKRHGSKEAYDILIKNGAIINIKNVLNLTARDISNMDGPENIDDAKYYDENTYVTNKVVTHEDARDLVSSLQDRMHTLSLNDKK